MIYFIKIRSENMKMTWNINLFIFCMICNFSKCNVFTVLWISSIKQYGIKFIATLLEPGKFDTKITSKKKCYLHEGRHFIVRVKVGSLARIINKEVLAQSIYKHT